MKASRLKPGDEIRVTAPSLSMSTVQDSRIQRAIEYFRRRGFKVTFSRHCREMDMFESSSPVSRISDLQEAFLDSEVKAVLACTGGFNVNELLEYLDYSVIRENPKILCGFSDIMALLNAVWAKTGLITYHGPDFSTFGEGEGRNTEYTYDLFRACMIEEGPYHITPSPEAGSYEVIQEGYAAGRIVGGNLCTLNLLQGTEYMPDLSGAVLFIEDDNIMGEYFVYEFERNLQSLLQCRGADEIKGIVFGRFEESCRLTREKIAAITAGKRQLQGLPVIFNADFGHVFPMASFPVGGVAEIRAEAGEAVIRILEH